MKFELLLELFGREDMEQCLTVVVEDGPEEDRPEEELFVGQFLQKYPDATCMKCALEDCYKEFRTRDPNSYFSKFGGLLTRSSERFKVSLEVTLKVLQSFFPLMRDSVCKTVPVVGVESEAQVALTEQDADVLQYIGGFILRRLFYERYAEDVFKDSIIRLKNVPKPGSIAFEKNRGASGDVKLWGIDDTVLALMKSFEIYFRQHALKFPDLKINSCYCDSLLGKEGITEFKTIITTEHNTDAKLADTFVKSFKKFTMVRSHAYSVLKKVEMDGTRPPT